MNYVEGQDHIAEIFTNALNVATLTSVSNEEVSREVESGA